MQDKRRTRAQMGRCQGGFCTPRLVRILARELGFNPTSVTKRGRAGRNVRTFLPQHIDPGTMDQDLPILLRAAEPEQDVRVELRAGDRLVARGGKKRMVRPGETERVMVRPKMAEELRGCGELQLSIVPAPPKTGCADSPPQVAQP